MLKGKSLVNIDDVETDDFFKIFGLASEYKERLRKGENIKELDGRILSTLFFEPSTRTRLSFESAMHRLGGSVITVSEPKSSSTSKGETIADTLRMASSYSDVVVMRHPMEGAARLASEFSSVPVINGGDGSGQHPTQTLLDLFTIWEKFGRIENLNVSLVGDLKYGRTVHSLIKALSRFDNTINLVSPEILQMPDHVLSAIRKENGIKKNVELESVLSESDVFYVTRIQKERFVDLNDYSKVIGSYSFDLGTVGKMKKEAIIMHPLPRVDEISPEVDNDPRAFYFKEAANGVFVRMAIISMILGVR
ncbi:aspartate carbamoyltransferase [Cuniculiplasma sp. SKW3]|uniref:aspartate carbamoyltransferase n=1 Tax=unclassified Cuniculiplasma TaxID=2619706 RepID=UPI003FD399F8